jgi:hypothetical protein
LSDDPQSSAVDELAETDEVAYLMQELKLGKEVEIEQVERLQKNQKRLKADKLHSFSVRVIESFGSKIGVANRFGDVKYHRSVWQLPFGSTNR